MKLYEIDERIYNILENATDEDGVISDEAMEELEALQMARDEKLEACGIAYKNLKAEEEALKQEKMALQARQSQKAKQAEKLSEYITFHLKGAKFETPKVKFSWRKSDRTIIDNLEDVPAEFIKIKREAMSAEIKKAIKAGTDVPGARVEEFQNLQIK